MREVRESELIEERLARESTSKGANYPKRGSFRLFMLVCP